MEPCSPVINGLIYVKKKKCCAAVASYARVRPRGWRRHRRSVSRALSSLLPRRSFHFFVGSLVLLGFIFPGAVRRTRCPSKRINALGLPFRAARRGPCSWLRAPVSVRRMSRCSGRRPQVTSHEWTGWFLRWPADGEGRLLLRSSSRGREISRCAHHTRPAQT